MTPRSARALLCGWAIGAIGGLNTASAADRADLDARLDGGEIVTTSRRIPAYGESQIQIEAVVDVAPERLWDIVTDCANFRTTMPRIMKSERLSVDGDTTVCRSTVDLTWPLPDLTATTRVVQVAGRWHLDWELVSGDYQYNQGSWDLTPFRGDPSRTHVLYTVLAAPDIPVPDAVKKAAVLHSLPGMIRGLRSQLGVSR